MTLTLKEALTRVPLWEGKDDVKVTPLGGGITNQNFRVDLEDNDSYVLRLVGANTELLGIDRENEYIANQMAGSLGIAPEVVYFIRPEGCLVTRFIRGRSIPPEEIRQPENLSKVAGLLKKIHAMPAIPGSFSVFKVVEEYTQVALRYGIAFPENFDWLLQHLYQAGEAFAKNSLPLCPCHNDLLNENFLLVEDTIYILDWEYAGMGDRFFDLANFSVNHSLTDEQDRYFLKAYFGEVTEKHWAYLKIMKVLSDFRESMWGLVQTGISKLDFDFRGYADRHFKRMTQNLQDPRWNEWIAILKE